MSDDAPARERAESGIVFREGRGADAPLIAQLMFNEITWARIREFGLPFVTVIHRHLCTSRHALCKIAEKDGRIIGYCAVVSNTDAFNREFYLRHGWKAAILILPRLFRWRNWQTAWKGLTFYHELEPGDPTAEISVFAVDSRIKGTGVGRDLFGLAMQGLKERGCTGVRIGHVDVRNDRANAFYKKYGFKIARTVPFYKDSLVNIYIYKFD